MNSNISGFLYLHEIHDPRDILYWFTRVDKHPTDDCVLYECMREIRTHNNYRLLWKCAQQNFISLNWLTSGYANDELCRVLMQMIVDSQTLRSSFPGSDVFQKHLLRHVQLDEYYEFMSIVGILLERDGSPQINAKFLNGDRSIYRVR
jgi:hypothetical protein